MAISFGGKNRSAETKLPEANIGEAFQQGDGPLSEALCPTGRFSEDKRVRLIDLRSPAAFGEGFIPGSYNVPDLQCMMAARQLGLFVGRSTYLLADTLDQLQLCSDATVLGNGSDVAGWFGADAIVEWQRVNPGLGSFDAIDSETLAIKVAALNILILDIHCGESRRLSHPNALRFRLEDLPLSLDGLPEATRICLTSDCVGVSSFAASLLWNFGFQNISYLASGASMPLRLGDSA
jgi:rhodanese-related sulfurtransferase